jgi:hypothetical protein
MDVIHQPHDRRNLSREEKIMAPGDDEELKLPDEPIVEEPADGDVEEPDAEETDEIDDASGKAAKQESEGEEGQLAKSRGSKQFGELRAQARESQARADRLEREIASLRTEREADRARVVTETPEQENARLALMTPEERIDYKLDKAARNNQQQMQQIHFQTADQTDRLAYQTKAATDTRYAKYADEVEAKLAEARRTGGNPQREVVLKFILGEKLLANQAKSDSQKKAAAETIKRQKTSPMNGKGDQAAAGRKSNTLAKRLENVEL